MNYNNLHVLLNEKINYLNNKSKGGNRWEKSIIKNLFQYMQY